MVGNTLSQSPEHKINFNASYRADFEDGSYLLPTMSYSLRSGFFDTFYNNDDEKSPAYGNLDARLNWYSTDEMSAITARARNITNEEQTTSIAANAFRSGDLDRFQTYSFAPPRMISVDLKIRLKSLTFLNPGGAPVGSLGRPFLGRPLFCAVVSRPGQAQSAAMVTAPLQQVEAYVVPLLRELETLTWIARNLHPIGYQHLLRDAGLSGEDLRHARASPPWSPPYSAFRPLLDSAADLTLAAIDGLFEAAQPPEDMQRAWRAFRNFPRALEALYPLAGLLPPVSRFYLDQAQREDGDLIRRLAPQPPTEATGVQCLGEDPNARASVWVYVPETYTPARPHPVVFALHGGSGNGRAFLWSWVRAARSRGAIVVAPSSVGQTWSIQGRDPDSPRLTQLLRLVQDQWTIDPARILLTGMSDGGTFTYTSGLAHGSPFTHLAPVAAAFHPMFTAMADTDRLKGLPIHIIHGDRDWMFPRQMADDAAHHLANAGANVTYRPLAGLSHAYGVDLSTMIFDWLLA